MKIPRIIWIAVGVLLLWMLLSWRLGEWIGLRAPGLYYMRGGLWILGIIGFVGFLLLRPKGSGTGEAASVSAFAPEATRTIVGRRSSAAT